MLSTNEKNEILSKIDEDPYSFYNYGEYIRNDPDIARFAFTRTHYAMLHTSVIFNRDEYLAILTQQSEIYQYLPEVYKNDNEFINIAKKSIDYSIYCAMPKDKIEPDDYYRIIVNTNFIKLNAIKHEILDQPNPDDLNTKKLKNATDIIETALNRLMFCQELKKNAPDIYTMFELDLPVNEIKQFAKLKTLADIQPATIPLTF